MGNIIALKVELIGPRKLKLSLWHLDERFMPENDIKGTFMSFQAKHSFTLYTRKSFQFSESTIRFPTKEFYKRGTSFERNFPNDIYRKAFLKRLYTALHQWNHECPLFKDDKNKNENVILHNEFWVI